MHLGSCHLRGINVELDQTANAQNQVDAKSPRKNHAWHDRQTALRIREQTKVGDMIEVINKLKWKWSGHLAKRMNNRWTTRITQ